MRRLAFVTLGTFAILAVLMLALAVPAAAHRASMWGDGSNTGGDQITMTEARQQAQSWLDQAGLTGFSTGEIMQFTNHFYIVALDAQGNPAVELLVSRDGTWVHPEPTIMWNTTYNPMLGGAGSALQQGMMYGGMGRQGGMMGNGMMGNGMMGNGMMGNGMMGNGDMTRERLMDPSLCQSSMGITPSGSQLSEPLTADAALAAAQAWLDANRPGTVATESLAFPGYFTVHIERDGVEAGMLSVQASTGAIWEHTWHGNLVTSDAGA